MKEQIFAWEMNEPKSAWRKKCWLSKRPIFGARKVRSQRGCLFLSRQYRCSRHRERFLPGKIANYLVGSTHTDCEKPAHGAGDGFCAVRNEGHGLARSFQEDEIAVHSVVFVFRTPKIGSIENVSQVHQEFGLIVRKKSFLRSPSPRPRRVHQGLLPAQHSPPGRPASA